MTKLKKWEELQFSDDFMFKKVMMNKEICKRVLESIMEIEIADIKYIEEEKTIDAGYDAKSIRLDVYVKDEKNTVYNIEMQNTFNNNIPKRSRYYQGAIDMDLITKGEDYEKLNKSVIIFVCTFDFVGENYCKYTFVPQCLEVEDCILNDGTTRILINTLGQKGDPPKELTQFINSVNGVFTGGELADIIYKEIQNVKQNKKVRREYMNLYVHDYDVRREGREEGREEEKVEAIEKMLSLLMDTGMEYDLAVKKIAAVYGENIEYVEKICNKQ